MKHEPIIILTGENILNLFNNQEEAIIKAVASASITHRKKDSTLPHSCFLRFPGLDRERIIALPAYLGENFNSAGIKWISSFPENIHKGIERASAIFILNDMETGRPKAVMESSIISARRTAASAALAGDLMAKKPLSSVGLIGCGPINFETLRFLKFIRSEIKNLFLYDISQERLENFAKKCDKNNISLNITFGKSYEEVFSASDLVAFATTAVKPYIKDISACKPDAVILHTSLRDLLPEVILSADNIVDDVDHVLKADTSVHLAEQQTGRRDFIRGTLADILMNKMPARIPGERTIFSPFGMGVLDLALADLAFKKSRERGIGIEIMNFFPENWMER